MCRMKALRAWPAMVQAIKGDDHLKSPSLTECVRRFLIVGLERAEKQGGGNTHDNIKGHIVANEHSTRPLRCCLQLESDRLGIYQPRTPWRDENLKADANNNHAKPMYRKHDPNIS